MKCTVCGYDDHGTGDFTHACRKPDNLATLQKTREAMNSRKGVAPVSKEAMRQNEIDEDFNAWFAYAGMNSDGDELLCRESANRAWQAAQELALGSQKHQEAIVKAALEAAVKAVLGVYSNPTPEESGTVFDCRLAIRNLDVQQILESVK